jgi:hypothetical protein
LQPIFELGVEFFFGAIPIIYPTAASGQHSSYLIFPLKVLSVSRYSASIFVPGIALPHRTRWTFVRPSVVRLSRKHRRRSEVIHQRTNLHHLKYGTYKGDQILFPKSKSKIHS